MYLYAGGILDTKPPPSWANKLQREKWQMRGLIIWNDDTGQATHMYAKAALDVLEFLIKNEDWKEYGVTMGEPAMRFVLNSDTKGCKPVLIDTIDLNTKQTEEFIRFLESNHERITQIAVEEDKENRKALGKVYSLLVEAAARRKTSQRTTE